MNIYQIIIQCGAFTSQSFLADRVRHKDIQSKWQVPVLKVGVSMARASII